MASTENLLPCPFCCGEPHVMHCGVGTYMVQCLQCKATTDDGSLDRISANWNRRDFSPMAVAGAFVMAAARHVCQPIEAAPMGEPFLAETKAGDWLRVERYDNPHGFKNTVIDNRTGRWWTPARWMPLPPTNVANGGPSHD